jgi:ABC-2 type transport system ATP-binding protein
MEEAGRLCERVAVVDHGKLLALGTPAELIASLGAEHIVEVALDDADRLTDPELLALPGVERVERTTAKGDPAGAANGGAAGAVVLRLTVREVHRAVPPLLALLAARGLEPRRLTTHHATLEDVFLHLAGRALEPA